MSKSREDRHTYSDGICEWDVHRLWELAKDLPVVEMQPEAFHELEEYGWEEDLNLRILGKHIDRVMNADLSYPIIVSADGNLMDGCHRLLKAHLAGVLIKAVFFEKTPPPDRVLPPRDPQKPLRST